MIEMFFPTPVAATALLTGASATALATSRLLGVLSVPDGEASSPYLPLRGNTFSAGVAAVSLFASVVVGVFAPGHCLIWMALSSMGALSICIDARTRYLPRQLAYWCWAMTALGLGVTTWIAADPVGLIRALVGAAALAALGLAGWWLGQLGFGDVRLLAVIGATTASISVDTTVVSLLIAAACGAVQGVVSLVGRRVDTTIPYGPSLWLGSYLALMLSS